MKIKLLLPALLVILCCAQNSKAQWTPQLNKYPVVSQPGATLAQIIDTLTAHADPADSAEGGEEDLLFTFKKIWQQRVNINDSSGQNMFQQYYHELEKVIAARATSGSGGACTGSGYQGRWEAAGPNNLQTQNAGFVWRVWGPVVPDVPKGIWNCK